LAGVGSCDCDNEGDAANAARRGTNGKSSKLRMTVCAA